jgi:hypothetical protein
MSRIIYTNFSDHNDLAALDAQIKRYYAIQQSLGKSREYLVGLAMKYRKDNKLTVTPSLAELRGKHHRLLSLEIKIKNNEDYAAKVELGMLLARDRILGNYPEDKY